MDKAGVKHNSKKADFKYYGDHDRELMWASTQTCNMAAEHVKKNIPDIGGKVEFLKNSLKILTVVSVSIIYESMRDL